jgi:hypothetical protein
MRQHHVSAYKLTDFRLRLLRPQGDLLLGIKLAFVPRIDDLETRLA